MEFYKTFVYLSFYQEKPCVLEDEFIRDVDITKSGERLGNNLVSLRKITVAPWIAYLKVGYFTVTRANRTAFLFFLFTLPLLFHLIAMMDMSVLLLWPLLPVALRLVAALPPPQEPFLPTQSTPIAGSVEPANLPLVVWHGLGDKFVISFPAS